MNSGINDLKKTVFYEMLNMAGRVFILVSHSENVIIGNRGFMREEKENGIVLVFNQGMSFSWDEAGISAVLAFGPSPEKCLIPAENIVMIYSPELNSQFVTTLKPSEEKSPGDKTDPLPEQGEKVVKIDFTRKHRRQGQPHES